MPFTMIHLGVAKNLVDKLKINKISDFYLGAISPDAVHFRENYKKEYKDISHLYSVHDNFETLLSYAKEFISKNTSHEYRDFYLGYGIHIFTDLYWGETFRYGKDKRSVQELKDHQGEDYWNDMCILDLELYKKYEHKAEIWEYFSKSQPIGIDELVSTEEVGLWFNAALDWFEKNKSEYKNPSKYILYDDVLNFMEEAAIKIYADITEHSYFPK